ncbi:uncharacterized protein PV06_09556 [Exophiala oligosperma]|uniref:BZIP domain-containing protein n=1 Tax=Exophiala oligosperma TaxID=215243 RepID=A0A0D2BMG2_9EURO|nr:uncharacterized protein PV06_09556 [Exophiala oligosperma]KIW38602.1 hypothetical protein PV06_09556 [Exophiala oligosperma]
MAFGTWTRPHTQKHTRTQTQSRVYRTNDDSANVNTDTHTNGNIDVNDGVNGDDNIPTKKKKYVRVITEKRREQNRRAQKLYKERLKKKLVDLEGLAQSVGVVVVDGRPIDTKKTTTTPDVSTTKNKIIPTGTISDDCHRGSDLRRRSSPSSHPKGIHDTHDQSSSETRPHAKRTHNTQHQSSSLPGTIPDTINLNLADAFTAAGDLPFASGPIPGMNFSGRDIATPTPPPTTHDIESLFDPNLDPSLLRNNIHEDLDDVDLRHIWPMPPRSPGQTQETYSPAALLGDKRRSRKHHQHSTAMILTPQSTQYNSPPSRSGRSGMFPAFGANYNHHSSNGTNHNNSSSSSNYIRFVPVQASHLPDPYSNHMRLWLEDNIEASIAVASAVGISRSEYINDHPSRFPGCYIKLNQPDNRSLTRPVRYTGFDYPCTGGGVLHSDTRWPLGHGVLVTKELQDHMDRVQPALRPTPAQLLQPHPSYLDCIVFPFVRERAICASTRGLLDHAELFLDLMHGGMVCWGGGSGTTTRAGRRDTGGDGHRSTTRSRGMAGDVAWDTRSWEAKRWFLKKWEWLVGSEEDEERRGDVLGIWRGSRWWWRMRGEEEDDDEEEEEEEEDDDGFSDVEDLDLGDLDNFNGIESVEDGQEMGTIQRGMYPDLPLRNDEMDGGRVIEIEGHCL